MKIKKLFACVWANFLAWVYDNSHASQHMRRAVDATIKAVNQNHNPPPGKDGGK